jgi:hypothetical protein
MAKTILILLFLVIYCASSAQFVAMMEVKEPIPGLCNANQVYVLLSAFKGQEKAVCPVSEDAILQRLNSEVKFLIDNPEYDDKGMIGLVINCKGDVVQCNMDNKTKSPELDKQIEDVFNSLGDWKPGKLKRKDVDTSQLFSFVIKDGKVSFD